MLGPSFIFNTYYVALYAPIAVMISFFPLWLRSQGLTEADVGVCLSLGSILAIVANPIVGVIADRTGRRERLLIILGSTTALMSLFNLIAEGFTIILMVYLSVRLFSSGLIPLSESIVLAT
jgi:PPP family 3-phenylpropionic acid transporter